ncbi:MmcQ/YjbR family DNA-binding protein [uncultured Alistipes sp.]|nr:MmcQ/YjbR family DNA-binding protein [uncultured Alistipes sp.]
MDILEFRDYCLSLPMSEECTPFDETTLVYKIGGKMYAYAGMENFTRFAVKCDPDRAVELRERYREITPAWHSSKRHWNDVYVTGDLPEAFLREQIRHSYLLVLQRNVVPKSLREEILRYIEEHEPPR